MCYICIYNLGIGFGIFCNQHVKLIGRLSFFLLQMDESSTTKHNEIIHKLNEKMSRNVNILYLPMIISNVVNITKFCLINFIYMEQIFFQVTFQYFVLVCSYCSKDGYRNDIYELLTYTMRIFCIAWMQNFITGKKLVTFVQRYHCLLTQCYTLMPELSSSLLPIWEPFCNITADGRFVRYSNVKLVITLWQLRCIIQFGIVTNYHTE